MTWLVPRSVLLSMTLVSKPVSSFLPFFSPLFVWLWMSHEYVLINILHRYLLPRSPSCGKAQRRSRRLYAHRS
jgi:hypothetical protein